MVLGHAGSNICGEVDAAAILSLGNFRQDLPRRLCRGESIAASAEFELGLDISI